MSNESRDRGDRGQSDRHPKGEDKSKRLRPYLSSQQLNAHAMEAHNQVAAMATLMGISTRKGRLQLLKCIISKIGWLKASQALMTGSWFEAIGAIDFEGVIDCVSKALGEDEGGGGGGEFSAPSEFIGEIES